MIYKSLQRKSKNPCSKVFEMLTHNHVPHEISSSLNIFLIFAAAKLC